MPRAMHVFRILGVVFVCTLSPLILSQPPTQAETIEQTFTQVYDQQGPSLINGHSDIDYHPVNFADSYTSLIIDTDVGGGAVLAVTTAIGHAQIGGPITLHGTASSHVKPSPTDYIAGLNAISGASAYYRDMMYAIPLDEDADVLNLIDAWGVVLRADGRLSILGIGTAQTHVSAAFGNGGSAFQLERTTSDFSGIGSGISIHELGVFTSAPGLDPFDPEGFEFSIYVNTYSSAHNKGLSDSHSFIQSTVYTSTSIDLLGFLPLDSSGNVISGIGSLASLHGETGFSYEILDTIPTIVPEPPSVVLLGAGGLTVAGFRLRRRRTGMPQS